VSIGKNLRILRINSKKTLREQSETFGVSLNTVYRWEHDLAEPRKSTLRKIAAFYGVSLSWLFSEDNDKDFDRNQKDIDNLMQI